MSARSVVLDAEAAAELAAIDAAREDACVALREANQRGVTSADLADVLARFVAVDIRIAELQRKVWPRYRGRLVVALGDAVLISPTGRSSRLVWRRAL